jgi:hypothetical protein
MLLSITPLSIVVILVVMNDVILVVLNDAREDSHLELIRMAILAHTFYQILLRPFFNLQPHHSTLYSTSTMHIL